MSAIGQTIESIDESASQVADSKQSPKGRGSIATLILGESGSGKTTSLRNLDPETTLLIQSIRKPLPFRPQGWKEMKGGKGSVLVSDEALTIESAIENAHTIGKQIVVIDDFQYVMANEFMRRAKEKGFDKFSEIGQNGWIVLRACSNAASNVTVYLMAHVNQDNGTTKAKTVGRMIDEKIVVEGMFTVVLRAFCNEGEHIFSTRNSGSDTVKAPMGMFEKDTISNDIAAVDATIRQYYGL